MADYPDYAARAVRAEERAERSEVADGWRNLARRYRALSRQHTEMAYRCRLRQKQVQKHYDK
jgi:hypothetical protein